MRLLTRAILIPMAALTLTACASAPPEVPSQPTLYQRLGGRAAIKLVDCSAATKSCLCSAETRISTLGFCSCSKLIVTSIANKWLDEGLPLAKRVGNPALLCGIIGTAGDLALREGALHEAVGLYREASLMALAVGNEVVLAENLLSMGHIAVVKGQPERALVLAGAADALREDTGTPLGPSFRLQPAE